MAKFNDELLVSPLIRQRLMDESEDTQSRLTGYWAVLTKATGVQAQVSAGTPMRPDPMQQMFALDMAQALNRHLRHDGAWIVFWTHPVPAPIVLSLETEFRMWHFLWIDEDGDPGFTIDNEDPFQTVLDCGPDHWIESAEHGWQQWKEMMRDVLDPSAEQTFKRAQGQAPTSLNGNTG